MGTSLSGSSLTLPYTSAELRISGRQPSGTPKKLHQKRPSGERREGESERVQWAGEEATSNYVSSYSAASGARAELRVPATRAQVEEHRAARVGHVGGVHAAVRAAGQVLRAASRILVERSAARPQAAGHTRTHSSHESIVPKQRRPSREAA